MASYSIIRFDFLPGTIVLEDGEPTNWRVRAPLQQGLDAGLRPDLIAALGANKDRVVGRVVCRIEDGTEALAALYLDAEGGLHWGEPFPVAENVPRENDG
jgi:hypothetical protein